MIIIRLVCKCQAEFIPTRQNSYRFGYTGHEKENDIAEGGGILHHDSHNRINDWIEKTEKK